LAIRRILAAFAILGLVTAPLAKPAMSMDMQSGMSSHVMVDDGMADHAATAMPEGMPCCPEQTPMPDCGKHCLMVLCAATVVPMLPSQAWLPIPASLSAEVIPARDPPLSGISQPPPPKPPRA
jgi:hypothetical protein